jgi:hypothetical protein
MKRRSGREMSCDASHQSQGNDLSRLKATEFRCHEERHRFRVWVNRFEAHLYVTPVRRIQQANPARSASFCVNQSSLTSSFHRPSRCSESNNVYYR